MQAVLEQNLIADTYINRTDGLFGERIGLVGSLFGCWHKEMSRPFSTKHSSYRSCLNCGARRRFDPDTLTTKGPYYYPPAVRPAVI